MVDFDGCEGYSLIDSVYLEDIGSKAYTLVHEKTKAKVVLIQNSDRNKAFMIGFRTPVNNSTGVPHIIEHSVLCGSKKYPVKDAISEISKGSLNTYMNAFTYPDRTCYPFATVNNKDFDNLMDVYLDAVFNPRILTEPKIFMQEGWHYELEKNEDSLKINGVVYNEMKGVYSNPEDSHLSYVQFSLFPDTQYGKESGGDPESIPQLSYEEFISFYKKYYHPSNSRIFLYGDMDFKEKLLFIDKNYLSKYEYQKPESDVVLQKPFDKPVYVTKEYPVLSTDEEKEKTFLSYNVVCSDYRELEITAAMEAINYALCSVPGAILEKRLLDAGIGKNVFSDMTTSICQKTFSIVAEGADPEKEEQFVKIVEDTINEVIRDGFDKKALEAAITSQEFSYREADFGYMPKGIVYAMMTLDDWNYSDEDIFNSFTQNKIYKKLREAINSDYFERILKERVLENNHKTILKTVPKEGLAREKEEKLQQKLDEFKASLSKKEINEIIKSTKALAKYQIAPDSKKALATIPSLTLSDIDRKGEGFPYEERQILGKKEMFCKVPSNRIAYFNVFFDASSLPQRLIPAFSIMKILMGMLDTKNYKYGDLINETNIVSGNLNINTSVFKNATDTNKYKFVYEVRGKAFYEFLPRTFELIKEILFTTDFSDKKRIKERLEQSRTGIQAYMQSEGHSVAIQRSLSYFSETEALSDTLSGLAQYRFLTEVLDSFDEKIDGLIEQFNEINRILLTKNNVSFMVGCEEEGLKYFEPEAEKIIDMLDDGECVENSFSLVNGKLNEGLASSSTVSYAVAAGNYRKAGLPYTGSLSVLSNILNTEFLWNKVRIQGGAYGVWASFGRSGDSYFTSYRDPHIKDTFKVYKDSEKYIRNYRGNQKTIDKYIITSIGAIDTPLTPSVKTGRTFSYYMAGVTDEDIQKSREELLATTTKTVKEMSSYIKAVMDNDVRCVVAGEEMLKKESDCLKEIVQLC